MQVERQSSQYSMQFVAPLGGLMATIFLFFGCSSEHRTMMRSGYGRVVTPLPPALLTSAAAFLFTNNDGFSARVEFQTESSLGTPKIYSGELLGRGGMLLYAPDGEDMTEKKQQPGNYSFVWNVADHRGFVLSEALQGYAPVTSALQITNFQVIPGSSPAERIAGHPSESARALAVSAEGNGTAFDFYRAIDLKGVPLRITSITNTPAFTLTLSKVRLEAPPANIFLPPDGFTRYNNPEAMADELAAREHNLRRKSAPTMDNSMELPQRRY
jgi:hypothetical protein